MGVLFRFRFTDELVEQYPCFVETGLGFGASMSYAVEHKFKRLSSIEYDGRLVERGRLTFGDDDRVKIVHGNSGETIGAHLHSYPPGTGFMFWLDAHWPGSDYFGEPYVVDDPKISLPLQQEIEAIRDAWDIHRGRFIAIIDDAASIMMLDRGARYLLDTFAETHDVELHTRDDGYAVIIPKGSPRPEYIEKYDIFQLNKICRRYVELGDWSLARGFAGAVIAITSGGIDPPHVGVKMVARGEACRMFAADAVARKEPGSASDLFIEAMGADPLCIDYRLDYIYQVLLPVNWRDMALSEAKRCTKIVPTDPRGWCAVAECCRRLGDLDGARHALEEAEKLHHNNGKTLLLKAAVAADAGEFDEALLLYEEIIGEYPHHRGECLVGIGVTQARAGEFVGAIETFDRAIEANPPDEALAKWNRAENLLTLGRYAEGWPDHGRRFELQFKTPGVGVASSRFRRPMWEPNMDPCRVLVQSEQGYGDVICMARYVPMLRDLGHQVQFEVDPKLVDLFQQSPAFEGIRVIPRAPDYPGWLGIDDFDVHMPTMCFPAAFGTTTNTCPWDGPYLIGRADAAECSTLFDLAFRTAIEVGPEPMRRVPRIGLCWSSGRRDGIWEDEYCNRKSVPQDEINRLITSTYFEWRTFEFPTGRMKPDDDGPTFADSANVLAGCDLLITCDTGIAHLGGAMGVPTWIMMHSNGSWHWMVPQAEDGRWTERSPWYPSVRLFRQRRPHEWGEVMNRIAACLNER